MDFVTGKEYRRRDLNARYGGKPRVGISTPANHPFIMLFTGETGHQYGYRDGFQPDGIFWYTGEGQVGDMQMIRGNRAIYDSPSNGKALHMFEYIRSGWVCYVGGMIYLGHHEAQAPDREGNLRKVIIFELALSQAYTQPSTTELTQPKVKTRRMWGLPLKEVRTKALTTVSSQATLQQRRVNVYNRSQAIKIYVLRRANGTCEGCDSPAPFTKKDRRPYLEVHHLSRLSDGGPDHPIQVASLCPNCHRKAHYAHDAAVFNHKLMGIISQLETSISLD